MRSIWKSFFKRFNFNEISVLCDSFDIVSQNQIVDNANNAIVEFEAYVQQLPIRNKQTLWIKTLIISKHHLKSLKFNEKKKNYKIFLPREVENVELLIYKNKSKNVMQINIQTHTHTLTFTHIYIILPVRLKYRPTRRSMHWINSKFFSLF